MYSWINWSKKYSRVIGGIKKTRRWHFKKKPLSFAGSDPASARQTVHARFKGSICGGGSWTLWAPSLQSNSVEQLKNLNPHAKADHSHLTKPITDTFSELKRARVRLLPTDVNWWESYIRHLQTTSSSCRECMKWRKMMHDNPKKSSHTKKQASVASKAYNKATRKLYQHLQRTPEELALIPGHDDPHMEDRRALQCW